MMGLPPSNLGGSHVSLVEVLFVSLSFRLIGGPGGSKPYKAHFNISVNYMRMANVEPHMKSVTLWYLDNDSFIDSNVPTKWKLSCDWLISFTWIADTNGVFGDYPEVILVTLSQLGCFGFQFLSMSNFSHLYMKHRNEISCGKTATCVKTSFCTLKKGPIK